MIFVESHRSLRDDPDPRTMLILCNLVLSARLSSAVAARVESSPFGYDERKRKRRGTFSLAPRSLRSTLETLEASQPLPEDRIVRRVAEIGARLRLQSVEVTILDFCVRMAVNRLLNAAFWTFLDRQPPAPPLMHVAAAISIATGLPEGEVHAALRDNCSLRSSALLDDDWEPAPFVMRAATSDNDSDDVFDGLFSLAASPGLTLDDFSHVRGEAQLMVDLVAGALRQRAAGIHVLIYGPPGVGKTELSRVIAKAAGATLFEIGTPKEGEDGVRTRTDAYGVAQLYLREVPHAVIRFDEVEDAFVPPSPMFPFPGRREASSIRWRGSSGRHIDSKAFTNQMLENSPVPSIWVGNAIEHIGPAAMRRFQLSLLLESPPADVRARILSKHLEGLNVASKLVDKLARDQRITPAHVQTAVRAAKLCAANSQSPAEELFEKVLRSNLGDDPADQRKPAQVIAYDLQFVRADADLSVLVQGLKRTQTGRVLLYGAPGTGKTALASHIAESVGKSLMVARASELLSKWLGETEKIISDIFSRAARQSAVLLIDEADSLLFPRAESLRRWEVSQTNELLMQIERFEGVLLCATNDAEGLDEATYRRFDLKVRLLPPDASQRWLLFEALLSSASIETPSEPEGGRLRVALDNLPALVPGDFAAVRRKIRLAAKAPAAADVVAMLASEHSWKSGVGKQMVGFGRSRI